MRWRAVVLEASSDYLMDRATVGEDEARRPFTLRASRCRLGSSVHVPRSPDQEVLAAHYASMSKPMESHGITSVEEVP
jgi:hypothetical protein